MRVTPLLGAVEMKPSALSAVLATLLPHLPSTCLVDCTVNGTRPAGSLLQGFLQGTSHSVFSARPPVTVQSLGPVLRIRDRSAIIKHRALPAISPEANYFSKKLVDNYYV
ncbi:MAG TPA: hypothetical protein PK071_04850 [Atopobiaceae bacterium]|nr:hypothetical protein [Atopobiaceae bacterium]